MEFKKYSSIENAYNKDFVESIKKEGHADEIYVVQEKRIKSITYGHSEQWFWGSSTCITNFMFHKTILWERPMKCTKNDWGFYSKSQLIRNRSRRNSSRSKHRVLSAIISSTKSNHRYKNHRRSTLARQRYYENKHFLLNIVILSD